MTDNQGTLQEKNDDLDLLVLLSKAIRFFKAYGVLLLIASLTGLLCGFILNLSFSKYYTTRLLMESTVLNNLEQGELIDNWDMLMTAKGGSPLLAKALNCSPETARSIWGLTSEALPNLQDGTNVFTLEVKVGDISQLKNIQDALLWGFRNNDYVREKVALRNASLRQEVSEAAGEITKLDSTKHYIESLTTPDEKKGNDHLILDLGSISKEKVEIGEKLATYKEKLAFGNGVQLVQGTTPPRGPKPGTTTLLGLGLAAGFLVGYFIALLKALVRISKQSKN
jgi:hypothetical protein